MGRMMNAEDVQKVLQVSQCTAYKIIKQLNEELTKNGFLTVRGKVSKDYFNERFFGISDTNGAAN